MRAFAFRAALAAPFLLLAIPAHGQPPAAPWRLVTSADFALVFVDDTSIVRAGDVRSYTALAVFRQPQDLGAREQVRHMRVQSRENCRTRTSQMVALTGYSESGRNILTEQGPGRWDPVTPGTDGESLFRYICEGVRDSALAAMPPISEAEAIRSALPRAQ
jgi:hypothetical protein